jgi:NAD(P)-dependent dehydrogenase (short-subunit alcohol dehydrogenase family)
MKLPERTVIITGGAAGIGAEYSAGLVREGAVVYIADIADGSALAATLSDQGPGRAVFVRADVADEESVRSLVAQVMGDWGRIDVLVNNAALFAALPPVPYDQISLELWDRSMAGSSTPDATSGPRTRHGQRKHMSYITAPEASQLTAGTRDQLELFAAAHGHFSALRAIVARFPAALGALDNQYSLIMGRGRLDRWAREAVFAACSAERGNAYLAGAMAAEAVRHGADPDWVNGLLTQDSNPIEAGEAVGALIKFARKMAREPYKSVEAGVSALHAAGWANEDLVELLSVISLSAYMDTLSLSLRIGGASGAAASQLRSE